MDPPDMDAGRNHNMDAGCKHASAFKNRAGYDRRRRPVIARNLQDTVRREAFEN
jgi:hypothetical protein